jgi:hypothetical protein
MDDVDSLRASPAFFARKFPDDPAAPVRTAVLGELAAAPPVDESPRVVPLRPYAGVPGRLHPAMGRQGGSQVEEAAAFARAAGSGQVLP